MAAYRRVDDLRDQLWAPRSVSSMGKPLSLPFLFVAWVSDRIEAGILHEQFDGDEQPAARSVSGERSQLHHRERQQRHVQRLRRRHSHLQRRRYGQLCILRTLAAFGRAVVFQVN